MCVIYDSGVIDQGDRFIHFLKSLEDEGYLREVLLALINLDFLEHLLLTEDVKLRHLKQLLPEGVIEQFLCQCLIHPI